jgi:thioredoxin reductase
MQTRNGGNVPEQFDVAIVGGGPAGLSAALILGRSLRRTVVFDHGEPRNLAAAHAHNLFTREGVPPEALADIARRQLAGYASVCVYDTEVLDAVRRDDAFLLRDDSGREVRARRVLLATGVEDDLPAWEGFDRFWGRSVFHCPYCHGWESRGKRIAVLGDRGEAEGMNGVEMMRGWTRDLVLCTDGAVELSDGVRDVLALLRVEVREERIAAVEGGDALERVRFTDGSALECEGLYLHPPQRVRGPLVERLGCRLHRTGLVEVGSDAQTSCPGVFAAGDMASTLQQVVTAAASGTAAAISLNRGLLADDLAAALAQATLPGAAIA